MDGAHRVIILGVALRFFLREGDGNAWAPVTDAEFHDAYQASMFDADAFRHGVLCPNLQRVEQDTSEGWYWWDGRACAGMITLDDKTPQECEGLAQFDRGRAA